MQESDHRTLAAATACGLLFAFLGLLLINIGAGGLSHIDEFRTAERSREFWITNDWRTVHKNFTPDFRKPPLQYWATALTMGLTENKQWPPRIWSGLGAMATLVATMGLARAVHSSGTPNVWPPVLGVLFCLLNTGFLISARSALLDTWMIAFNTAALAGALAAQRDDRWWCIVGVCVGLGAWQKAPTALGLVALLCVLWAVSGQRAFLRCRTFWWAMSSGAAAAAAWALWQFSLHGVPFLERYFVVEIVERTGFIVDGRDQREDAAFYLRQLWETWGLLGLASPVALVMVVSRNELRRNHDLRAIASVAVLVLVLLSAMAFRDVRYTLYAVPLLSVVVAYVLVSVTQGRGLVLAVLLLTSLCWPQIAMAAGWPPKLPRGAARQGWNQAIEAARTFGAQARDDEQLIFVVVDRPLSLQPEIFLYYGNVNRAMQVLTQRRFREEIAGLPRANGGYRGLVHQRCWPLVEAHFPGASKESVHGEIVHWFARTVDRSAEDGRRIDCEPLS